MTSQNDFQIKLNELLFTTTDYNNNIFINNFAKLLCYNYFVEWEVKEYTKSKVIWMNKLTNIYDTDGKFIIHFLLNNFQNNLQCYNDYLKKIIAEYKHIGVNETIMEWNARQKIIKINDLYEILLNKEFHDKLVYYMSILA